MIYTVSPNSSVDYTFYLSRIVYDDINRIEESRVDAGGKGLNVARMLTVLGCDCRALALLGGPNGSKLKTLLDAEGIKYRYVEIRGNVRSIFNFFSAGTGALRFNENGPSISKKEQAAFYRMLEGIRFKKGDILSMSGSLPPGMDKTAYGKIIEEARKKGVLPVLDADGDALKEGIRSRPFIIKPNLWELERASGRKITSFAVLEKILKNIMEKGISTILLTFGEKGAVLFSESEFLYARAPEVKVRSTIGCGDAFLAGFLSCFSRNETPEHSLRTAVACGTAKAATEGTAMPDRKDVREILRGVTARKMAGCPASLRKGLLKR